MQQSNPVIVMQPGVVSNQNLQPIHFVCSRQMGFFAAPSQHSNLVMISGPPGAPSPAPAGLVRTVQAPLGHNPFRGNVAQQTK